MQTLHPQNSSKKCTIQMGLKNFNISPNSTVDIDLMNEVNYNYFELRLLKPYLCIKLHDYCSNSVCITLHLHIGC